MPLTTEREQRQQEELIRLATELARKDEIIAALQAANVELHERMEEFGEQVLMALEHLLQQQDELLAQITAADASRTRVEREMRVPTSAIMPS